MKLRTLVYISIWLGIFNIQSQFKYNQSYPFISSILYALCAIARHLIVIKLLFNSNLVTHSNILFCLVFFVCDTYTTYNEKQTMFKNNQRFYFEYV